MFGVHYQKILIRSVTLNHQICGPSFFLKTIFTIGATPGLTYHANHTMFPYMETSGHTKKKHFMFMS